MPVESKICVVCKRPFSNRKRYASRGQWNEVKYCSDACRKHKSNPEYLKKFQP